MKKIRIISLLLAAVLLLPLVVSCGSKNQKDPAATTPTPEGIAPGDIKDYAAELKLDMNSESLKQEVTVKNYVDGDTTHFYVPTSVTSTGVLKARYLAINTPESTGKIEEYGKKASNFTKEKLMSAVSIIIESDNGTWNLDSTGARHLVWVWYKTEESGDYKNLNVEILQNGLAIASNSGNNRYGSTCLAAIAQARAQKLNVYSGQKDPDFYYGEAIELTLKELRTSPEKYKDVKVAFEAVVAKNYDNTAYVEWYDEATELYYGITVFYGGGALTTGLEILTVGNLIRVVGKLQYYETGKTWQVAGLSYRPMKPDDPNNIKLISEGHQAAYKLTDPKTFATGKVTLELFADNEDEAPEQKEFGYAELAMSTSVSMENLKVVKVYTTTNEASSSVGAMTLTCRAEDGSEIDVRTVVLKDENGNLITASAYEGKTINVKGVVDFFDDGYQIKVFSRNDITVVQ